MAPRREQGLDGDDAGGRVPRTVDTRRARRRELPLVARGDLELRGLRGNALGPREAEVRRLVPEPGQAPADDHGSQMPAPIPVEFWICEYNEGKSASDLEPVIKEWKKTMGKGREYESWMLTPAYSSQNLNNGVVFTGWWPDFASMGAEVEYVMEKVNPKMDQFLIS